MHLSQYSDYSCRVLIYLALEPERKASIEEIAQAYGISYNHLVKVVHHLSKAGFLETSRGRTGGVLLAKRAEEITFGEVVRKTENLHLVECFDRDTNTCPIDSLCSLKHILFEARESFLRVLDSHTLAEVGKNKKGLASILNIPSPAKI